MTTQQNVPSILFIRGYNTDILLDNTKYRYSCIDNFFLLSNYNLKYFNYSSEENLHQVYTNLVKELKNNTYDIVIGHSMGGGLLLKYMTEHKENIIKYKKIIYLIPMIYKKLIIDLIVKLKILFLQNIYLPKWLFIPDNDIYNKGNIFNDSFNLVSVKQIFQMNEYIPDLDLSLINSPNSYMLYAKDELLNVIDSMTLNKINNKIIVNGKHECFNEFENSTSFFQELKKILIT